MFSPKSGVRVTAYELTKFIGSYAAAALPEQGKITENLLRNFGARRLNKVKIL